MNINPKVLVMLSVYSGDTPASFYYSVKSILDQTYRDLHLYIFVDGCVCEKVAKLIDIFTRNDQRVRVFFSDYKVGLARGMNKLIDIALTSDEYFSYFARMDADDICILNRIEQQVNFLECHGHVDILGTNCKEFGESNYITRKYIKHIDIKKNFVRCVPFVHPTVMFKRRVFANGERYPVDNYLTEDLSFWEKLINDGYYMSNLPTVLLSFRVTKKTFQRRSNIRKAYSELKVRVRYSVNHDRMRSRDFLFAFKVFFIKIMPSNILRYIYKTYRA